MPSFALITEGVTDQAVLEILLNEYYDMDLDFNQIQPLRDATDQTRDGTFGGWEKVLEFCALDDFDDAFLFNDYLLIQIDTDCGEHPAFGVPLTDHGRDRAIADIIAATRDVIVAKIGAARYARYRERIFFAISVHSLECWLLPLYAKTPAARKKTKSCEAQLERELRKTSTPYKKDYQLYQTLAKPFRQAEKITSCRQQNASLDAFLTSLPALARV